MAVSLAVVGGWFAQAFIQTLIDKASDKAIQLFAERRGFAEDMETLCTSLRKTQTMLDKVQSSQSNDTKWMQKLKDAAYDAEDLIDEFQYHVLRQKIKGEEEDKGSGSSGLSYFVSAAEKMLFGSSSHSLEEDDMRTRVREMQGRLERIANSMDDIMNVLPLNDRGFMLPLNDRGKQLEVKFQSRESCSSPATDILFGREKELNQVVEWLLGSANQVEPAPGVANDTFSVLSITGIGGVGKSTLAQYVYKDIRIQHHFDLKIWVCVSHNFSVQELTKSIIQSVTQQKQYDNMSLESLQKKLHEHIAKKKFLLFLDDMWSDKESIWEKLCALLKDGAAHGSKIIVTTRVMKVSKMVNPAKSISLHGLDVDVFWQLFKKCSFGTLNPEDYPGLENIGRKIACKLKGSPLAAKTIGRVMKSNLSRQRWTTIMESDIWEIKQDEDDIMPALQLSYQYLDENLKQCFAFCSMFPKDYTFDKAELVLMWMAEGFINEDKNTKRMEDVGSDYFLEFVDWSFFQESEYGRIVMHDLIHDLAEWISVEEICRIENNRQTKPPSTTRHLRVEEKLPREFLGYNKLRTLVSKDSLPDSLFEKLRSIRVLDVSRCDLPELSEHIGKLIHLRYLDISWNSKIKILPDSLCDLYNLQTLKAKGCSELESIPQELGKLVNLRHVDISCDSEIKILPDSLCDLYNLQTLKVKGCSKLESIPQELGKLVNLRQIDADGKFWVMLKDVRRLTNLQELPTFSVQEDNGLKLGQLKDLTQLHGTLRIQNLENVVDSKEAQRAELKSKVHLKKLVLEWDHWKLDGGKDTILDEEVIEGLQPHESLKILKIEGYSGGRPPSWLMLKVLSNLEKLELKNCTGWDDLPFIGQRLHLIKLRMTNMSALKRLSHEFEGKCFPRLEVLELSDFPTLREWSWTEGKDLFPCMRELRVCSCPKLKRLPPFPPLEMLTIECCPRLILNSKTDDDEEGGRHLPPSLKELKLTDCGEYARLLSDCLNSLTRLEINDCLYMPSISLVQLVELQCLYISDCDELRKMECLGLLKSLEELKIVGCPKLVQLDDEEAGSLSSLRKLCVDNTALLKMFPLKNSLPFITELEIKSCEKVISVEAIWVRSLTAVTSLTLCDCMKLQSLPTELLHGPPLLARLSMQNCPRIKSLPEKGLPPLLRHLRISGCPHIQAIPEQLLPMSLFSFYCCNGHPTLMEQSKKFNPYWNADPMYIECNLQ